MRLVQVKYPAPAKPLVTERTARRAADGAGVVDGVVATVVDGVVDGGEA